jgi:Fe-S-cluster-containing hydrogenase component 2
MSENGQNLSRRKFMTMSSVAIATPFLLNLAGSVQEAKSTEKKTTNKTDKIYFITNHCIGCQACRTFCPVKAIHFGDTGNEIDQKKCIHCGVCYRECPISVISETIL